MDPWLGLGLLVVGVAGAVVPVPRLPSWAVPVAAAMADLALGVISLHAAGSALRALLAPVAFLLCAVPMSVMLDRLGLFAALARRVPVKHAVSSDGSGGALVAPASPGTPAPAAPAPAGAGYLWALAALVTTFLNLDAAVVLLTPLYVNVARQRGANVLGLGVQPVLLACLASSALPVSNLTNLIAASWTGAGTAQFIVHLGLPSLAATVVGWWAYRRAAPALAGRYQALPAAMGLAAPADQDDSSARPAPEQRASQRGRLKAAGVVVGVVLVGFTFGYLIGAQPWMVALAAVAVLAVIGWTTAEPSVGGGLAKGVAEAVPWRSVPLETAAIVMSLGVLADAAARHLHIDSLLRGNGVADMARDAGVAGGAANVVNNLPALLVSLGALGHHTSAGLWAVLVGVNMGPVLLVTGSLASLLWLATMRRLGAEVRASDFTRFGVAVGLPAAAAGLAVLLVMRALGVS